MSARVTGPVPGPSSTTSPCAGGPTAAAMARASARPDGATAPVRCGVDISDIRKWALSPSSAGALEVSLLVVHAPSASRRPLIGRAG